MSGNALSNATRAGLWAGPRLALLLFAELAWTSDARGQCWSETAKVEATNPAEDDFFGSSVSLFVDTAIVGAPGDDNANGDNAGSVFFFERDLGGPGNWGKVIKQVVPNGDAGDNLGYSVSIDGNTAVAGAIYSGIPLSGGAYVYERDLGGSDAWGQAAVLWPSDGENLDLFGASVAIDGDTIVVGAPWWEVTSWQTPQNAGAAYVFERDHGGPNAWGEVIRLETSDPHLGGFFGEGVAIRGDTIVVGSDAAGGASFATGAAYVFERNLGGPSAWGELTKLWPADGEFADGFGSGVSLDSDTLLVGAPYDDNPTQDLGSAYVFERNLGGPNAWGERAKLTPSDGPLGMIDQFGWSVSVFGDTAIVGPIGDKATGVGSAYLFERHLGGPDSWGELAKIFPADPDGGAGIVSIWSTTLLLGGFATVNNEPGAGATYVYERGSDAVRYCTPGTSGSGCQAILTACGMPSASASSGFTLAVMDLEGSSHGVFFFGSSGRQANPWGNGTSFQCVLPPVHRTGVMKGVGTPGACDGSFSKDLNAYWCPTCPKPNHNPGAGALVQAQLWYRDKLSTSNQPTSLSDAVEVLVGP